MPGCASVCVWSRVGRSCPIVPLTGHLAFRFLPVDQSRIESLRSGELDSVDAGPGGPVGREARRAIDHRMSVATDEPSAGRDGSIAADPPALVPGRSSVAPRWRSTTPCATDRRGQRAGVPWAPWPMVRRVPVGRSAHPMIIVVSGGRARVPLLTSHAPRAPLSRFHIERLFGMMRPRSIHGWSTGSSTAGGSRGSCSHARPPHVVGCCIHATLHLVVENLDMAIPAGYIDPSAVVRPRSCGWG